MKNSILFIVFNRPHQTRIVFDEIKKYKPNRLYVSADGPRELFVDDKEKCLKVMEVVNDVDWQCELKILKHDVNLGCKIAASTAVKWFFENEEQGIVLEDDTVPVQSFFLYCDEMLKRYENHKEVAFISGSNLITSEYNAGVSYFFSKHSMMWGWASWRDRWKDYDVGMVKWMTYKKDKARLKKIFDRDILSQLYWSGMFDEVYEGDIDTWDYQWFFQCWANGMLSIIPNSNMIDNIGFESDDATHTKGEKSSFVIKSVAVDMRKPIEHPRRISRDLVADKIIDKVVFDITWKRILLIKLQKVRLLRKIFILLRRVLSNG